MITNRWRAGQPLSKDANAGQQKRRDNSWNKRKGQEREDCSDNAHEEERGGGRLHQLVRDASKFGTKPLMLTACLNELKIFLLSP